MQLKDFDFDLPNELIAQQPLTNRDFSRLLVVDKKSNTIEHKNFYDITNYLKEGDCLVLNDTKVIPARLYGYIKKNQIKKIEILILNNIKDNIWQVLSKPSRKIKLGDQIIFKENLLTAYVIDELEDGKKIIEFNYNGNFDDILNEIGEIPLPPYITKKLIDTRDYQTIYAKNCGSIAAPTAGLHFTETILNQLKNKGINIINLTLHVGLGTFKPVKTECILDHKMHEEQFYLSKDQADIINYCKKQGKKIIAVGTTSCRTLETCTNNDGKVFANEGSTNIFIYPGYKFKIVDSLITNFHLPKSTLIMLISAFYDREKILQVYKAAIEHRYRFFSFGDAMFIK